MGPTRFLGSVSINFKDGRNKSGVYAIINRINSRNMYVGSAKNIAGRWSVHRSDLKRNRHHSPRLQNAWNKYGEDSFLLMILVFCEPDKLRDAEQNYIDAIKPVYNVVKFANRPTGPPAEGSRENHFKGKKHSEETKLKMRESRSSVAGENNPMFGVHLTGNKNPMWGHQKPETADFNIRTKKGRTYEEMYGPERAAEIRSRISEKGKGKVAGKKRRPIVQVALDGQVVAKFANVSAAGKALGKHTGTIYECLKGDGTAYTAHGYIWRYTDEA